MLGQEPIVEQVVASMPKPQNFLNRMVSLFSFLFASEKMKSKKKTQRSQNMDLLQKDKNCMIFSPYLFGLSGLKWAPSFLRRFSQPNRIAAHQAAPLFQSSNQPCKFYQRSANHIVNTNMLCHISYSIFYFVVSMHNISKGFGSFGCSFSAAQSHVRQPSHSADCLKRARGYLGKFKETD